jgi:hypothetical protein
MITTPGRLFRARAAVAAGIALIMFSAARAADPPPPVATPEAPPQAAAPQAPPQAAPPAVPPAAKQTRKTPGATAAKPAAGRAQDRLELDPTAIRGNQELPKVLYIVPWKDPGLAEPGGPPVGSLIDEALAPVDREVFRRQTRYFEQLYPSGGAEKAGPREATGDPVARGAAPGASR